jgi:hypothetical protein
MRKIASVLACGLAIAVAPMSVSLYAADGESTGAAESERIQVAEYDSSDRLIRPGNIDEWILLGASVGHGYPGGESRGFSLDSPGLIQIIQMEPAAYQYFKKHKQYADGTMLALSFYNTQEEPSPAVDGVVQDDLATFEIHLIDKQGFEDKRAFYLFSGEDRIAPMVSAGNDCVDCHNKHAKFDGTFTQFYPVARDDILGLN